MAKPSIKVGDRFTTNFGGDVDVLAYNGKNKVTVKFEDGTTVTTRAHHLKAGTVLNPNRRSFYGVGFAGVGPHKITVEGAHNKVFTVWSNMLQRCYSSKTQVSKCPTYIGCTVAEEWHNFQNFACWYADQKFSNENFQLDKDLSVIGNKVYGPEFCTLIPSDVNCVLLNCKAVRGEFPLGVHFHKQSGKFRAEMTAASKRIRLGLFATPDAAFSAYKKLRSPT